MPAVGSSFEVPPRIKRRIQFVQGTVDERVTDAPLGQPATQQRFLDIAVVEGCLVAEIGVIQTLPEQRDDAGLGALFDLADGGHVKFLRH